MNLVAKPIVKNKFWIVERDGQQIATIQKSPSGVAYVQDKAREQFGSIKILKAKHGISFGTQPKTRQSTAFVVNDFPCVCKPYNALYDVSKRLPVFTKSASSKSFYCAGHYMVNFGGDYTYEFCPKLISLSRYEFLGPFKSKREAQDFAKSVRKS